MTERYYGSYAGPIGNLYGRAAILSPCEETYEDPKDEKMVMSQFMLPVWHPVKLVNVRQHAANLAEGWHRFPAADFVAHRPLPS